jgi:hypothetical protein
MSKDWYVAVAYCVTGAQIGFEGFAGETAESDAREHFEALKALPTTCEVWWAKLAQGKWEFIDMVERNCGGEWTPIRIRL